MDKDTAEIGHQDAASERREQRDKENRPQRQRNQVREKAQRVCMKLAIKRRREEASLAGRGEKKQQERGNAEAYA